MSGDREAYQAAMREAHALAWSLKWESASQKYHEALAEFPGDPTARLSLAVALTRVGDTEGALREYLQARELLPSDTLVLARIGDLYARMGNGPGAANAFVEQSRIFLAQGDADKATAGLRRALDVAGRDTRSLLAIAEAARGISAPSAWALLAEVETLVAQAPALVGQPAAQSREPITPVAPTAVAVDVEESVPPPGEDVTAAPTAPQSPDDPSQLIEAADYSVNAGKIVPAILYYLRAADLLAGSDGASSAFRAAVRLVGGWLPGELAEVAELPVARRELALETMVASNRYLRDGYPVAAADEVFRAVGGAPTYLPAQLRLAEVEHQIGRTRQALDRVSAVASLYELRGEQPRAVAALRLQVEMDADPDAARRRLIDFMVTTRQTVRAADELLDWAREALTAGSREVAAERYRESVSLVARVESLVPLGETVEALGDLESARLAFDQAHLLSIDSVSALAGVTRCAAALGDWPSMENGLEVLAGVLRTDAEPRAEVIGWFRAAIARAGERPGLIYCLGILLIASGDEAEGEHLLRQVADAGSRPGRLACYHLGERDALANRVAEATRWFWQIGEPANVESEVDRELAIAGHRRLVDLCGRSGDWDGAARGIEGLLRVYPDEDLLHTRLAEVYFRLRKVGEAVRVLGELATVYAGRGEIDRALGVERGRAQIAPLDGEIRARLGRLLLGIDRIDEGLAELDSAVKLLVSDGRKADAAETVRVMLDVCRHRDPARALTLRETLVSLAPEDAEAHFGLIDAYIKLGRSMRAESAARQVVDQMLRQYRLPEAARALRIVIQLAPWNLEDRVRLGRALGQIGEIDEALATLRGVLSRDPANREANESLTSLLSVAAAQTKNGPRSGD